LEAEKKSSMCNGLTVIPGIMIMHSHAGITSYLKRKASEKPGNARDNDCNRRKLWLYMVAPIRKGTKDDPHLRVRKEGGFSQTY